jgi:creatinine amidohydrolase
MASLCAQVGRNSCQNGRMRLVTYAARGVLLLSLLSSTVGIVNAANLAAPSLYIEELTSPELQSLVAKGTTTILIPIGGTEQNGPHMVLGKHNVRAHVLAGRIAQQLGHAVVAPILAYVPEGNIRPPVAHMRFTGTISIPEAAFEAVLEGAARSFKQHGFRDIVFLGDHGGHQKDEARVAQRLNREWAKDPSARVHALLEYYAAATTPFNQYLLGKGYSAAEIGTHAGLADTAMAMAVDPRLVRTDQLAQAHVHAPANGVYGDPQHASAELGQSGLQHIVDASVVAIQAAIHNR